MLISPAFADWLLHNLDSIRLAVELYEPRSSTGIVVLPVRRTQSDPVGEVAVARATVGLVLDCVDRAVRRMPREWRRLVRLKYRDKASHRYIAAKMGMSEKTVARLVQRIRFSVCSALACLGDENVSSFCLEVDRFLS